MTETTPKLNYINQLLSTVNKNIAFIDNNIKLIDIATKEVLNLKNIKELP